MVRRHKKARWEAFIAPYRAIADVNSDYLDKWWANEIVTRPHLARIERVHHARARRQFRRHAKDRFFPHGFYGWLRRDYGRKQRRNR